jgi:hypothetical protein
MKTMFYTALGFATYRIGKSVAKKKARKALQPAGRKSS